MGIARVVASVTPEARAAQAHYEDGHGGCSPACVVEIAAIARAIEAAVADERTRWRWLWQTARDAVAPFDAWLEEATQRAGWHCHGCDGEFISTWPKWEKPTDATFPHAAGCQYVAALARAADWARS